MTERKKTKLTKAEKEFFTTHLVDSVVGTVGQILQKEDPVYAQAMCATVKSILTASVADNHLDATITQLGLAMVEQVPFKTIVKVDKFLRSAEYIAVMGASATVIQHQFREEFTDLVAAAAQMAEGLLKEVKEQAVKDAASPA